jgi:hypothetical protein
VPNRASLIKSGFPNHHHRSTNTSSAYAPKVEFSSFKLAPIMVSLNIVKVKSLATTNLLILIFRLVQFFFAGVVCGIVAWYIHQQTTPTGSASSPYVFSIIVAIATILTQFIYCIDFSHRLVFLWDLVLGYTWIMAFVWLLDSSRPLPCGWSAFDPFGNAGCGKIRGVLIFQIVLACMWIITAIVGFVALIQHKRRSKIIG